MTRFHWIRACEASGPICKFWRCEKFLAPTRASNPGTSPPPQTLVDIPMTLPRLRTHLKTLGKKKWSPKNLFQQSTWNCSLQLVTAYGLLLSRSNVMSVNTPWHSKIDFATKDNFDCKHFTLKRKWERKRDSQQMRIEPFSLGISLLTFRAHASSQNFLALSNVGRLIIVCLSCWFPGTAKKRPSTFIHVGISDWSFVEAFHFTRTYATSLTEQLIPTAHTSVNGSLKNSVLWCVGQCFIVITEE